MKKEWFSLIIACVFSMFLTAVPAEASNGTLVLTFKHKDSSGAEVPLANAYIYLRDSGLSPPMEEFFSPPDLIFGPTDNAGFISIDVPAGMYFIRATRRSQLERNARPLGPPEPNDYSWTPYFPITINPDTATDLGTQYAGKFKQDAVITGTIMDTAGNPLPGRYVRVQTVPCISGDEYRAPNYCGPVKQLAQTRTDANGRYIVYVRNPGTFYISSSSRLGANGRYYGDYLGPNYQTTGWGMGPVNVGAGGKATANISVPTGY